jgi:nucleolar GTP-binding protein
LYFIDLSEQCGYGIKEQVSLFQNLKPLFEGKPLVVVMNKSDMKTLEQCTQAEKNLVRTMEGPGVQFLTCSTLTEEGVMGIKTFACDALLSHRVESKVARATKAGKDASALGAIHVAEPVQRDDVARPPVIPRSVTTRVEQGLSTHTSRKLQKEVMLERGGAGVYSADYREQYLGLKDADWRFDTIPEIMDGKNVYDYVDPEIEQMLEALDREEEERLAAEGEEMEDDDDDGLTEVEREQLAQIRRKKHSLKAESKLAKSANHPIMPRTAGAARRGDLSARGRSMDAHLEELGFDEDTGARKRARALSASRGRSLERKADKAKADKSVDAEGDAMDVDGRPVKRARSSSRARDASVSRDVRANAYSSPAQKAEAQKIAKKKVNKLMRVKGKHTAKKGEADRHIPNLMPKHLYSGKRGMGKTDRR